MVEELRRRGREILPQDRREFIPAGKIEIPAALGKLFSRAKYTTDVKEFKSETLTAPKYFLDEKFSGAISEVYFLSDSTVAANKGFSCSIIADGKTIYEGTWDEFNAQSSYETDMSAFDDGTYYVLSFQVVFFEKSIKIRIFNVNTTVTFDFVKIKYITQLRGD